MSHILQTADCTKEMLHKKLVNNISEYTYREKRYDSHFAIAAIYTNENTNAKLQNILPTLRHTDKEIQCCDHVFCIVFDSVTDKSYVKAAENLNVDLKEYDYKNDFFISIVYSEDYNANYLEMTNQLFDQLQYALDNHLKNIVIFQDYII